MASFSDHFSGSAAAYAAYRPVYPKELVAELAALAPGHDLAWDCATGNGQAAGLLARHFDLVLATDASPEQIRNALPEARVSFRVGHEDDSGAADASVDLVTVATALHWLDLSRFYGEARRVSKPGGVLAAWCYGFARITPEIDRVTTWFAEDRVGKFWPPQRVHVDNGYRDLPFPFAELAIATRVMVSTLTREQYIGYLGTWSSVAGARQAEGTDPIPELRDRLAEVWNDVEVKMVTWPLHSRVGRVRG